MFSSYEAGVCVSIPNFKFVIDAQLIKQLHFADDHFPQIDICFRHMKLEFALAFPTSNL